MTKHILTGGPGCGKTTLLNLLSTKGFGVVPEAAREVIDEKGGKYPGMQYDIYERQLRNESVVAGDFLDRSLADGVAYANHFDSELNRDWKRDIAAADYGTAFILDTLPEEFYVNDAARDETYEEALAIHGALVSTYRKLGFEIVQLPATTPADRLEKVLAELPRQEGYEHELKFKHTPVDFSQFEWRSKTTTTENNYIGFISGGYERIREEYDEQDLETIYHTVKTGKGVSRVERESTLSVEEYESQYFGHVFDAEYSKTRTTYVPLGDPNTKICVDDVVDLGSFIEIESATPRNVKIWANRFGLTDVVEQSYAQMVRDSD